MIKTTFPNCNAISIMLPLFCVRIKPLGRAVSWFGHPVREPGAIYGCCNGLEPEFDLTGTLRAISPYSPHNMLKYNMLPAVGGAKTSRYLGNAG